MFDGVPSDPFSQFTAPRTSSLLPLPLSNFPLPFSAGFDPYRSSSLHIQVQDSDEPSITSKTQSGPLTSLETERFMDSNWSNDELLTLLKVRSSIENWFPDFTWAHVSRKLAELGFKRTAQQCKEKFEVESRQHFSYGKNYMVFGELEEFYQEERGDMEKQDQEAVNGKVEAAAKPSQETSKEVGKNSSEKSSRKRKRKDKFEVLKGYCEDVVNRIMAQQEELHNKLIEDIVKRHEENIAKDEAWKNQEMDRIKLELDIRTKEQANAGERQAKIIEFLKNFASKDESLAKKIEDCTENSSSSASKLLQTVEHQLPSSNMVAKTHKNPVTTSSQKSSKASKTRAQISQSPNESKEDLEYSNQEDRSYGNGETGKRWPRDQVLALINMRCKLSSDEGKELGAKGPLWERISQGMLELGYKRSAKRCKEKWENINKYFRKTKDSNKKRSLDSRTCPYFHQLSSLYSGASLDLPQNQ